MALSAISDGRGYFDKQAAMGVGGVVDETGVTYIQAGAASYVPLSDRGQ